MTSSGRLGLGCAAVGTACGLQSTFRHNHTLMKVGSLSNASLRLDIALDIVAAAFVLGVAAYFVVIAMRSWQSHRIAPLPTNLGGAPD